MNAPEIAAALLRDDVTLDMTNGDQLESILLIAKMRDLDTGRVSVSIGATGMDVLTQLGLLVAALDIVRSPWRKRDQD